MFVIAGGALAVVAAAAIISFVVGRGDNGAKAALEAAGCTRKTFASQGAKHVATLPKGFKYNSIPATSGPHRAQPLAPVVWNSYDDPLPESKLLHNLEHGGVVVQYGNGVPQGAVDVILGWYRESPNGIVVAPLPEQLVQGKPELANEIALTAWTNLQTCKRFNEKAFSNFVDLYRGQGPEPIPVESLQPGGQ